MGTLFAKWRSWRDDKRLTKDARLLQERGEELYTAGKAHEAIDVLKQAITLIGESDAPHVSLYGLKTAVLLPALMTSAYAAEKVGDRALALKSIGNARAILALLRRAEQWRPDEAIVKWENWAKAYADAQP
jgi:tetratricopeptide (TPR) repeat protein